MFRCRGRYDAGTAIHHAAHSGLTEKNPARGIRCYVEQPISVSQSRSAFHGDAGLSTTSTIPCVHFLTGNTPTLPNSSLKCAHERFVGLQTLLGTENPFFSF